MTPLPDLEDPVLPVHKCVPSPEVSLSLFPPISGVPKVPGRPSPELSER